MEGIIISTSNRKSASRAGVHKKFSIRRSYRRLFKKNRKRTLRYGIVASNLAVLILVVVFVTANPDSGDAVRQNSRATAVAASISPLDQLSSADIAVHAARMTNLPEAVAVTNQADSEATELAITANENKVVAKPQVVTTGLKSAKDITSYTAVAGDTIGGLAAKFGVTSDSIRWSNGLTREKIDAGKVLWIPPVTGIVYTVKSGDTADTIAQRYAASKESILSDNDAEIGGLRQGQRILIRGGVQPVAPTVTRSTAAASSGFAFGSRAIFGYNGYDYGYCTWYVANKRAAIGRPVAANLGNANTWDDRAPQGYNRTPAYGAAVVTGQRSPGHVAFVERVNGDGSIWISEMNSRGQVSIENTAPAGGWGKVDFKYVPAAKAASYSYIH